MASICNFLLLIAFLLLLDDLNVDCSQKSSVTVSIGYIYTHPRDQHLSASKVVLVENEKDLKLICSIDPPLPKEPGSYHHRDSLVQFVKVAPEYHVVEGLRYWSDVPSRTAVSINGTYMEQVGTYGCTYHGIWSFIDIVAGEAIARKLPMPRNFIDLEKFLLYREDKSSIPHLSDTYQNPEPVGLSFPCPVAQSKQKSSSVHRLLPSQVNIVAAMGGSLTAGVGAKASGLQDYFAQNRGVSFSIGGDGSLTEQVTLPNIVKHFNKDVKGYSYDEGRNFSVNSMFNVARSGTTSRDLPSQAQILANKMKSSTEVDYDEDWKIVTVFSGVEDLCRICTDKEKYSPSNFVMSIVHALKELQKVPRVLVNLVLPFDVAILNKLRTKEHNCKLMNIEVCPCSDTQNANLTFVSEMHKEYMRLLTQFVESGMFDKKDDFTVVIQPFFQNNVIEEPLDRSLFSLDCYHLSSKGHSLAAIAVWNNMLEDVNKKTTHWEKEHKIKCPTKMQPYISTRLNEVEYNPESNYSKASEKGGMPKGVVVFLSFFMGGIFIVIIGLIYRSRFSRPRNESLLSLVNNPYRAKI